MSAPTTTKSSTKDKNYDLIAVTQRCLARLDEYAQDAEREGDDERASLFRRRQDHSRRGGEECKQVLHGRISED